MFGTAVAAVVVVVEDDQVQINSVSKLKGSHKKLLAPLKSLKRIPGKLVANCWSC